MSKRVPVHALLRCIIAAEMFTVYHELAIGASDESRKWWAAAEKVRKFIDQPRLEDHHAFLLAQIDQMRASGGDRETVQ